jgi:WD40 repeat protein
LLATASSDKTIKIWSIDKVKSVHTLNNINIPIVKWHPFENILAYSVGTNKINFLDVNNDYNEYTMRSPFGGINCIEWSPSGDFLAVGVKDRKIAIWDMKKLELIKLLTGHFGKITDISWSSDSSFLASSSADETIRIWDMNTYKCKSILEGHTHSVYSLKISPDNRLLASRSNDDTVRIWRASTWDIVAIIEEKSDIYSFGLSFHPTDNIIATRGFRDHGITFWKLNNDTIKAVDIDKDIHTYVNAKIVLCGDTGVGKSGLALVMTGKEFKPTHSTHARKVWILDSSYNELDDIKKETKETFLWDLAGQTGYRLIHQLHLSEATIALIVFDAQQESDLFSGVRHWSRAIDNAQQLSANSSNCKKFLVSARCDRLGIPIGTKRLNLFMDDLKIKKHFITSAKENIGINKLVSEVKKAIDWEALPKVKSNTVFQSIKQFLHIQKDNGSIISKNDDLFNTYANSNYIIKGKKPNKDAFNTCIKLVEGRGLIRQLSFGDLVLLQPELLDVYASSMIDAARNEPDGFGCIAEEDARTGDFSVPKELKINDEPIEHLLCLSTIEDLLKHELAFRQTSNDGSYLVFPSQFTRDKENAPNPKGVQTKYYFQGPILNIYARLAVRLSHSVLFDMVDMWKNACTFKNITSPGLYGLYLNASNEGIGELNLFFESGSLDETEKQFEAYVYSHLARYSIPNSIQREDVIYCTTCGDQFPSNSIKVRVNKGIDWIRCSTCDHRHSLEHDTVQKSSIHDTALDKMEIFADKARDKATANTIIQGKIVTKSFDVFFCYESSHRNEVLNIANQLRKYGVLPWVDVLEIAPGEDWIDVLSKTIDKIPCAAVFVGRHPLTPKQQEELEYLGSLNNRDSVNNFLEFAKNENLKLGPWQALEVKQLLQNYVKKGNKIIPVYLKDLEGNPDLPYFLSSYMSVDFRDDSISPAKQLYWGITGERGFNLP